MIVLASVTDKNYHEFTESLRPLPHVGFYVMSYRVGLSSFAPTSERHVTVNIADQSILFSISVCPAFRLASSI